MEAEKKCPRCAEMIKVDARVCRFCGQQFAPPAKPAALKRNNRFAMIAVAVIGGLFVIGLLTSKHDGQPLSNASAPAEGASAGSSGEAASSAWAYSETFDKITGKMQTNASTTSLNTIAQRFPYSSETSLEMRLLSRPKGGTDVLFVVSSGQLMCHSFQACSGTVRFDDGKAQTVSFVGTTDEDSTAMFVESPAAFLAKLKRSKRMVVEKALYQAGEPQFEFDTHGLKWGE